MNDVFIIPGGGLLSNGDLSPWAQRRFDHAMTLRQGQPILCLSGGTVHKPPPLDTYGFPIHEATAGAAYLLACGVASGSVFTETSSYDTIGNAFFARVMHTDLRDWRRLWVITSEFHMPRTRAIFEWIFGLPPLNMPYHLEFSAASDDGLEEELLARRRAKEAAALERLAPLVARINTLAALHQFIFTEHDAYAVRREIPRPPAPDGIQDLY